MKPDLLSSQSRQSLLSRPSPLPLQMRDSTHITIHRNGLALPLPHMSRLLDLFKEGKESADTHVAVLEGDEDEAIRVGEDGRKACCGVGQGRGTRWRVVGECRVEQQVRSVRGDVRRGRRGGRESRRRLLFGRKTLFCLLQGSRALSERHCHCAL
jgi:hypothetical protein